MTFQTVNERKFKKPARPVKKVFIHCSASDNPAHDDPAVIEQWHKERGFSGIGYHFFIRKDGVTFAGRDLELTPAAQAGHNKGTIAICVHGLDKRRFTLAQRMALVALCTAIHIAYEGSITFHGHCEVANKLCPVFDYREWLNLDKSGRMKV